MPKKPSHKELEEKKKVLRRDAIPVKKPSQPSFIKEKIHRHFFEKEIFEKIFRCQKDAIFIMDSSQPPIIIDCNPAASEVFGYDYSELVGQPMTKIYANKESYEAFREKLYSKLDRKKPFYLSDFFMKRKNGTMVPVDRTVLALTDETGEQIGWIGVIQDISEKKIVEASVLKERERFKALVEEFPFGVSLVSQDGKWEYLNTKFTEIFGYTLEDIPSGRDWFKKAHPDSRYREHVISTWINDQHESKVGEARERTFPVTCKDGSEKLIHFRPVGMETGERFVIFEDITEKKQHEARLKQMEKLEAIGTLAGGIAHDFNNILGIILGNAELAIDDIPEWHVAKQNLKQIREACLRARDLVSQILSVSRKTEKVLAPIKLDTIIKESIKLLRASIPTSIEFHQDIGPSVDTIRADPIQINQILINLFTNAAHAMKEKGGLLSISLTNVDISEENVCRIHGIKLGRYVKLTVTDTGHGIPEDIISKIFDPYFTTKDTGEGTGMGLAVVQGIVKNHGGYIHVQSEPGKGSAFHIFFPSKQEDVILLTDIQEKIPKGNERLLFVDDEKGIIEVITPMLRRLGYKVMVNNNGLDALDTFRENPNGFDLVITDQTMPKMTGAELSKEILKIRPDLPIILCTGYSETITKDEAKAIGIREFLIKPIIMSKMAKTIREVLEKAMQNETYSPENTGSRFSKKALNPSIRSLD
ncbi:MAG: PAS domain S-box protein [Deltaproteobacteria bacterium]|nr:PAS domain S-box protein [Deltaproteobacteria bacterium]